MFLKLSTRPIVCLFATILFVSLWVFSSIWLQVCFYIYFSIHMTFQMCVSLHLPLHLFLSVHVPAIYHSIFVPRCLSMRYSCSRLLASISRATSKLLQRQKRQKDTQRETSRETDILKNTEADMAIKGYTKIGEKVVEINLQ